MSLRCFARRPPASLAAGRLNAQKLTGFSLAPLRGLRSAGHGATVWATKLDLLSPEPPPVIRSFICRQSRNVVLIQRDGRQFVSPGENSAHELRQNKNACYTYHTDSTLVHLTTSPEKSPSSRKTRKNENIFFTALEMSPPVESATYAKREKYRDEGSRLESAKQGLGGGLVRDRKCRRYCAVNRLTQPTRNQRATGIRALVKNSEIVHFADLGVGRQRSRSSEFGL